MKFGVPDYKIRWFTDGTVLKHLHMTGEKQLSPLFCCYIRFILLGGNVLWEPPKEMSVMELILNIQAK